MKWRWLVFLLLLLALVVSGAYWLFAQPAGARWSLALVEQFVPGLTIRWRSGSWTSGLNLHSLDYRASNLELSIDGLQIEMVPAALGTGQLRLRHLSADRVHLQLLDDGEPPAQALPAVAFPVDLLIERLSAPNFEWVSSEGEILRAGIDANLAWRDTELNLGELRLIYQQITAAGHLGLRLEGNYDLNAELTLQGEPLPGLLSLHLGGSLQALQVRAEMGGDYPVLVEGIVAVLTEGLPLQLQAHNSGPWSLSLSEDSHEESKVEIDGVQLSLAGEIDRFEGQGSARLLESRFGESGLALKFAWEDGELQLLPLQWQVADGGSISAHCSFFAEASRWSCDGTADEFALEPISPYIEGELHAGFSVGGNWGEGSEALVLDIPQLGGLLNSQPIGGEVHVTSEDFSRWDIAASRLQLGDNTLSVVGVVGDSLDLQTSLSASRLSQLLPEAAGALSGELAIRGSAQQPDLVGSFSASNLAWDQWALPELSLDFDFEQLGQLASRFELFGSGLSISGEELGAVQVLLEGNRATQVISAEMGGGPWAEVQLQCLGSLDSPRWQLICDELAGTLFLEGQQRAWSIDRSIDMQLSSNPQHLVIAPICLRMEPASLCLENGLNLHGDQIKPLLVDVQQLPIAWWSAWLPAPFELVDGGVAQGRISVDSLHPLEAAGSASVTELAMRWQKAGQTRQLDVETLEAEFTLDDEQASVRGLFSSAELGELRIDAAVEDPGGVRQLQGTLRLEALQLAALDGLLPEVEQLGGQVDARLALAGTVMQPVVEGRIELLDGIYQQLGLPYPAEDISGLVELRRDHAEFSTAFVVNNGSGSASGSIGWQGLETPWQARGQLLLDGISIGFLEDSVANISSDLRFTVVPDIVEVDGEIRVNEADIHLLSLPPDSIGPSPDTEIIGLAPEQGNWQVKADIAVSLGEQLRFRGFGADLELAGDLRVRNSRRELVQVLGEVRVASGFYRAYGQRLKIRRGSLLFAGPIDNPDLALEAIRESRNRDIVGGLRVSGTLQEPIGELFSEPPMSETDIAHYILTGRVRSSTERFGQGSAEGTLLSLGLAGANEPAAELARRFGINDFQISAENSEAGTETRVSGYLTPNLFISYGTLLKDRSNTVTLQYFITPNIIVEAVSGFSSALDFIYNFAIE